MTPQYTIDLFRSYVDDSTDLSNDDALALFNRQFMEVWLDRQWEFAKKNYAGVATGSEYISLPDDFGYIINNNNYTDETYNEAARPVVFVGSTRTPYQLVSWSDRRKYFECSGYCWVDTINNRLYFSDTLSDGTAIEFDYIFVPSSYALTDTIALPRLVSSVFQQAVYHGMCVDDYIMQQSDKAKSYAKENNEKRIMAIRQLGLINSQLVQI